MTTKESAGENRGVLIIIENLPAPFDRRVWQEATTLAKAGYRVSIVCPKAEGYENSFEVLDEIHIYRHPLPVEASGALGYLVEYPIAVFWEFVLALRVYFTRGFDAIHACNPPDLIFLVGLFFKWVFGTRFLFDHHDINPELFEAKFGSKGGFFYRGICWLERSTFRTADVSIATNESYREIALTRGNMAPERVFIVRSGPSLERLEIRAPVESVKRGRSHLVGYVGTMGRQEGIDQLLEAVRYIVHDKERRDIHFGLVGGGGQLEAMRQRAIDLKVDDYVTFTGRVSDDEMLDILNTADICVNPDTYNEMNDKSTMNKIMEYMALGKPVVQYDLKEGRFSAREASAYARPNDPIDLAEKMLELLDDPERCREMGRIGRDRVERELCWSHEAPKLLAAYDALFAD